MRQRVRVDWIISSVFVPLVSVAAGFVVAGIAVAATGADPLAAFTALFQGAFTNRNAFPETLVSTVPYVFLGLGVALGFRAGLFNIGAEGQFYIGALSGVFVAYSIHGLPGIVEIPLAMVAGMAGGFAWSAIAGFLKARFGAHECRDLRARELPGHGFDDPQSPQCAEPAHQVAQLPQQHPRQDRGEQRGC